MPEDKGPAKPVHLRDYAAPKFTLHETRLEFFLNPSATRVLAEMDFEMSGRNHDLVLDGEKLRLELVAIDGRELTIDEFSYDDDRLTIDHDSLPEGRFTLTTEVIINPEANSELSGLYLSNGMYCTQCEAEGFRRITFYPDRPDVLTIFHVKIHSDLPVKLSNGNLRSDADGIAVWHDPWPKPCYLFALVAGDLEHISDRFTTLSGREVDLEIYVRAGDEPRSLYAMDALKRSMKWDEEVYGREYDLDRFMIVAVDDFNMGAMENKGLNIFNSRLVLASPETATDEDYQRIEAVIAHEYFHNWTGNRITCRDWFQLSLKEGLTVFRDQQFSQAMRSEPVERIAQVAQLRARQFSEDASPLAHPVRPKSYVSIDNFYTATIYEKGAEVIRMLRTLVGPEAYARALDLYFARHDGEAATIEDWLRVFEDTTGRDLKQFKLWYEQAGTPRIEVREKFEDGTYRFKLRQVLPDTPGQSKKDWQLIPLDYAVFDSSGTIIDQGQIELGEEKAKHTLNITGSAKPVLSLNRHFSAPVIVDFARNTAEQIHLLRYESDDFTRYEMAQDLAIRAILDLETSEDYLSALVSALRDPARDPALRASLARLPSLGSLFAASKLRGDTPDPDACHAGRSTLRARIADRYGMEALLADFDALHITGDFSADAEQAGKRALQGALLGLIATGDGGIAQVRSAFGAATTMSESLDALGVLISHGSARDEVEAFYRRWHHDRLVLDKWFTLQSSLTPPDQTLALVEALSHHADFTRKNPNRFRALIGGFASGNLAAFHRPDGRGYGFVAREIVGIDAINPQISARLVTVFQSWRDFDAQRQDHAISALEMIHGSANLSKDLGEMAERLLLANGSAKGIETANTKA